MVNTDGTRYKPVCQIPAVSGIRYGNHLSPILNFLPVLGFEPGFFCVVVQCTHFQPVCGLWSIMCRSSQLNPMDS